MRTMRAMLHLSYYPTSLSQCMSGHSILHTCTAPDSIWQEQKQIRLEEERRFM